MAVACSSKCECMNCHNQGAPTTGRNKAVTPLHRLLRTPERTLPDQTMESDQEDLDPALEETILRRNLTPDLLDEITPTTRQREASMASTPQSPRSFNKAPEQDQEYALEMSLEASFKLSPSIATPGHGGSLASESSRIICSKSSILSPDPRSEGPMAVNESAKFEPRTL
eukprot:998543-Rhodomonas_salina.2